MATYEVTGPDGHKYRVIGPDDATQEQVLAQVKTRIAQAAPIAQASASAMDRAQAAASGVNTGALTQLPGLPVSAALNVADLIRAGYGTIGKATGMLSADQMPDLIDRSKVVMSPEWIQAQMPGAGAGPMIDPNVPTDATSRVLHSAGVGFASAPVPGQLVKSALGGAAAQLATEYGASPATAALAGLAPFAGGALPQRQSQPILTPEQIALRQRAKDLGYELTPAQESGKRWQQNIEAAMREAPSTSGRMQAIDARNTQLTNQLVGNALEAIGGPIDQGAAGAAAFGGMRSGIDKLADTTGRGYRDLLSSVPVNLEAQRGPLEAIRKSQLQLPADQQGGAAMGSLENLLGTPGYAPKQRTLRNVEPLNPGRDDVITAIRKLGGINPGDEAVGSLAKANPFPPDPRLGPVWRQPQTAISAGNKTVAGHSLDEMAARLEQAGYIAERDPNLVMDKIADSTMSGPQYSAYRDQSLANPDPLATAIDALTAKRGEKNAPTQNPGFLRRNPMVPGHIAQDMRAGYGAASNSAFERGKVQQGEVYAKMKTAVDNAIETSLPAVAKGQFDALNRKYGMDMAVAAMKPESQEAFLAQLYRGAPDQFYTFLGVADPKSFKATAQGFVSKLIEGATNNETKNVSASALGKAIDKLNPGDTGRADVMKYLGSPAAKTLTDVGAIGKSVLPDPIGNPGTAQRLWYQSLLRGGGLAGGAGVGAALGGAPGAMIGSILGDFVVPKAIQTAYLSSAARPYLLGRPSQKQQQLTQQDQLLRKYGGLLGLSPSLQQQRGLLVGQ